MLRGRRIRLADIALPARGPGDVTVNLPTLGRRVVRRLRLYDLGGRLLDAAGDVHLFESLNLSLNMGGVSESTSLGDDSRPTLLHRLEALNRIDAPSFLSRNEKVVGSIPTGGSTFDQVSTYDHRSGAMVAGPKMPSDATSGLQVRHEVGTRMGGTGLLCADRIGAPAAPKSPRSPHRRAIRQLHRRLRRPPQLRHPIPPGLRIHEHLQVESRIVGHVATTHLLGQLTCGGDDHGQLGGVAARGEGVVRTHHGE